MLSVPINILLPGRIRMFGLFSDRSLLTMPRLRQSAKLPQSEDRQLIYEQLLSCCFLFHHVSTRHHVSFHPIVDELIGHPWVPTCNQVDDDHAIK